MRTDVHRPSAINPEDYEFVALACIKMEGIGDALFIKAERERLQQHMAQTGGTYSTHEHGGNCAVCGSVNAIYNTYFYHAKTNSYVSIGSDCTEKIFGGRDFGMRAFHKKVTDAREYFAGRQKAEALLGDYGLSEAWRIYVADFDTIKDASGRLPYEEGTIRDIVSKFVKYGSISEKQQSFLRSLVEKIPTRNQRNAERDAQRTAEQASAADCPTGRVTITGTVLTIREQESQYGIVDKILVRDVTGFKVWGTLPRSLSVRKGDTVRFSANVEPSKDDAKFGFYKRPTKAEVIKSADTEEVGKLHAYLQAE